MLGRGVTAVVVTTGPNIDDDMVYCYSDEEVGFYLRSAKRLGNSCFVFRRDHAVSYDVSNSLPDLEHVRQLLENGYSEWFDAIENKDRAEQSRVEGRIAELQHLHQRYSLGKLYPMPSAVLADYVKENMMARSIWIPDNYRDVTISIRPDGHPMYLDDIPAGSEIPVSPEPNDFIL